MEQRRSQRIMQLTATKQGDDARRGSQGAPEEKPGGGSEVNSERKKGRAATKRKKSTPMPAPLDKKEKALTPTAPKRKDPSARRPAANREQPAMRRAASTPRNALLEDRFLAPAAHSPLAYPQSYRCGSSAFGGSEPHQKRRLTPVNSETMNLKRKGKKTDIPTPASDREMTVLTAGLSPTRGVHSPPAVTWTPADTETEGAVKLKTIKKLLRRYLWLDEVFCDLTRIQESALQADSWSLFRGELAQSVKEMQELQSCEEELTQILASITAMVASKEAETVRLEKEHSVLRENVIARIVDVRKQKRLEEITSVIQEARELGFEVLGHVSVRESASKNEAELRKILKLVYMPDGQYPHPGRDNPRILYEMSDDSSDGTDRPSEDDSNAYYQCEGNDNDLLTQMIDHVRLTKGLDSDGSPQHEQDTGPQSKPAQTDVDNPDEEEEWCHSAQWDAILDEMAASAQKRASVVDDMDPYVLTLIWEALRVPKESRVPTIYRRGEENKVPRALRCRRELVRLSVVPRPPPSMLGASTAHLEERFRTFEKKLYKLKCTVFNCRYKFEDGDEAVKPEFCDLVLQMQKDRDALDEEGLRLHKISTDLWHRHKLLAKRVRRLLAETTSRYRSLVRLPNKPYLLLRLIGRGGFAEVWEALHLDCLETRAIKIIEITKDHPAEAKDFIISSTFAEVTLQKTLKHPHIVEMQECFELSSQSFAAVLDYCEPPDLDTFIQMHAPLEERLAVAWTIQILQALDYVHTFAHILHFDIKPHNILLDRGIARLADFGLHRVMEKNGIFYIDMSEKHSRVGTVWYMAPEHLQSVLEDRDSKITQKFDIWSLGVTLYEMLFGQRPFTILGKKAAGCPAFEAIAASILLQWHVVGVRFPPKIPISKGCQGFLVDLLAPVASRPTAREALQHPYVREMVADLGMCP